MFRFDYKLMFDYILYVVDILKRRKFRLLEKYKNFSNGMLRKCSKSKISYKILLLENV